MAFDWKQTIASLAPTLGTMLMGPLAGTAITALESAFGLAPGAGEAGITNVIQNGSMTPDIIAAVRAADQKHAELMKQMDIDLVKLNLSHEETLVKVDADSADSARKRQMELKDDTPKHLAYIMICGFFVMSAAQLIAIMGWPEYISKIPPEGWLIVGNISGYLVAEAKQAATYFLGSTSASKTKDATIRAQATALNAE